MAVVQPKQRHAPNRLLIALLHAGVPAETVRQEYGTSVDELAALKACPVEPLQADDLDHVADDGYRYQLWKGELIRMSPGTIRHCAAAGRIAIELGAYLDRHSLGELLVAEPGFRVGPANSVISPDLAFIVKERLGLFPPDEFGPFSPDLAVEVRSPSNTRLKLADKLAAYLAGGAQLVWVLDARRTMVRVHRADGTTITLGADDLLTGEDLLPGFSVRVRDLFR